MRPLLLLCLVLTGCRVHTLEDGPFAFTVTEVLRDDCGFAGAAPVTGGALMTEGHQVGFTLDAPKLRLEGTYLYGVEELMLDGSLLNTGATLNGRACQVDSTMFHLEGTTQSPSSFTGTMSVEYATRQNDACSCRIWFKFNAARR